jgi:hypothetical protein
MEDKLVFFRWEDGEMIRSIVSESALIQMVNEADITGLELVKVLDIADPEAIRELHYVGWQPRCLIEFKDNDGNVVIRGYGEDH